MFTLDGSGVGPGAILDEAGVVGPVRRGTVMQVFGTGGGGRVTATVGGVEAEVLYAGTMGGLWQVNVRVPMDATLGERVAVVLTADGVATQAGVTVEVR